MAKYTGVLPAVTTSTLRLDQIKQVISDYLGDIFTLISDTGSTRRLTYKMPYQSRLFAVENTSSTNCVWYTRNIANTGDLTNLAASSMAYPNALQYTIIKNQNSGCIIFYTGTTVIMIMHWGTNGVEHFCSRPYGTPTGLSVYAITTDISISALMSVSAVPSRQASNGKELFYPCYCSDDSNLYCSISPIPDFFAYKNAQAIATPNIFTVEGAEYIALYTNLCLRIN